MKQKQCWLTNVTFLSQGVQVRGRLGLEELGGLPGLLTTGWIHKHEDKVYDRRVLTTVCFLIESKVEASQQESEASYQVLARPLLWSVSAPVWSAWRSLEELLVSGSAACRSAWSCLLCLMEDTSAESDNHLCWSERRSAMKSRHRSSFLTCFSRFPHQVRFLVEGYGWTSRGPWNKQEIKDHLYCYFHTLPVATINKPRRTSTRWLKEGFTFNGKQWNTQNLNLLTGTESLCCRSDPCFACCV